MAADLLSELPGLKSKMGTLSEKIRMNDTVDVALVETLVEVVVTIPFFFEEGKERTEWANKIWRTGDRQEQDRQEQADEKAASAARHGNSGGSDARGGSDSDGSGGGAPLIGFENWTESIRQFVEDVKTM